MVISFCMFLSGVLVEFLVSMLLCKLCEKEKIQETIRREFNLLSESDQDYFVTGYEDGWIKNDKISSGLYKMITNDIYYQIRKYKQSNNN